MERGSLQELSQMGIVWRADEESDACPCSISEVPNDVDPENDDAAELKRQGQPGEELLAGPDQSEQQGDEQGAECHDDQRAILNASTVSIACPGHTWRPSKCTHSR